jgi:hypothetical protein
VPPIEKAIEQADEADGPTLAVILDAVIARNESFERLSVVLAENTAEVQQTQVLLHSRPTKQDVAYHRRRALATTILLFLALIFAQSKHIEHCSPGARVTRALDHLIAHPLPPTATPAQRTKDFERFYNSAPGACDITFPLQTHDGSPWPSRNDGYGIALYAILCAGLVTWVLHGRREMVRMRRAEKQAQDAVQARRAASLDPDTTQTP